MVKNGQVTVNPSPDPLSIHNSDREFDVVIDDVREGGEERVRCNDGYAFFSWCSSSRGKC